LWQDNPWPRVWERSVPHIDQPEVEKKGSRNAALRNQPEVEKKGSRNAALRNQPEVEKKAAEMLH